jgi:ankyrin repeat protein
MLPLRIDVVIALVGHGADVNIANNSDYTPVCFAAEYGHLALVIGLVELGADVNIANNAGHSPLHYCLGGVNEVHHYAL